MKKNNLIPNSERTPSQLAEMGRKGGIVSGESKREKKRAKEIAIAILEQTKEVNGQLLTIKEIILTKHIHNIAKNPTTKDLKYLLEIIDEAPTKQIEVKQGITISEEQKKCFEDMFGMNVK